MHPKLPIAQIDCYGDLPDAKLVGRYSTPLLFQLWSQWIKQTLETTTAEVNVLLPIVFGISDLNRGCKNPKTGFWLDGTVSDDLQNTVN